MIDAGTMGVLAAQADQVDLAVTQATKPDGWSANQDAARGAMSAFWNLQGSVQSQGDTGQQAIINGLNARVHAAWGRLEDFLAMFDDPSTWASHSQKAMEAFNDAATLSAAAGQSSRQVQSYGVQQQAAAQTPQAAAAGFIDTSYMGALKRQFGTKTDTQSDRYAWLPKVANTLGESFLGVPVWAIAAVSLGAVYFMLKRK